MFGVDISEATNHLTGVLALVAWVGLAYAYRNRRRGGDYEVLAWAALTAVTTTVWLGRVLHAWVEPRSLITPYLFFGWTLCLIFVLTLLLVARHRNRRT